MKINHTAWILLLLIGLIIPFFVLLKNIYPDITLRLGETREYGAGLLPMSFGNSDYLVISVPENHPFSEADVRLLLKDESAKGTVSMSFRKGHIASIYPSGDTITSVEQLKKLLYEGNPEGIPNGALYSKTGQAFVVSRGIYYPIISPPVFESMGYNWNLISEIDSSSFAALREGEKIKYMSVHPDGTILKTKIGQYFVVWEGKKLPIKDEQLLIDAWETFYWIDIASDQPDYLDTCQIDLEKESDVACDFKFNDKSIEKVSGNFIISLTPSMLSEVSQGKAKLKTAMTLSKEYLAYSVGRIKNKLYLRYAGYLF